MQVVGVLEMPPRRSSRWTPHFKGAKGAPARVGGSPSDGLTRPAHLFAAPCPHGVPLVKIRSPPSDSHRSPPLRNDHHREVAVVMIGYFAEASSQPGPHRVAVGLPGESGRQTVPGTPFIPPGGDCEAVRLVATMANARPRGETAVAWTFGYRVTDMPGIDGAGTASAQETRKPRTRVARRSQFRSKDPS